MMPRSLRALRMLLRALLLVSVALWAVTPIGEAVAAEVREGEAHVRPAGAPGPGEAWRSGGSLAVADERELEEDDAQGADGDVLALLRAAHAAAASGTRWSAPRQRQISLSGAGWIRGPPDANLS